MPPKLSEQQRQVGYLRSLQLRQKRAEIKDDLKHGRRSFLNAWLLPACEGMKVIDLLQALPGIGRKKAEALCAKAKIPATHTVARCGPKQEANLMQALAEFRSGWCCTDRRDRP